MNKALLVLVGTQALFTGSDLLARLHMRTGGFHLQTFLAPWFLAYFLLRQAAMFGQLYVFSSVELGKTMALFGATSIVLSNLLGILLLREVLPVPAYVGVALAALAFLVLAIVR